MQHYDDSAPAPSILAAFSLLQTGSNLLSLCQLHNQIHCYFLVEKCENLQDSHTFPPQNNSVFVIFYLLKF